MSKPLRKEGARKGIKMMRTNRGQSILEYMMIVSILTVGLTYIGTGIKRGVQNMVKITADQVGNQANSDQDFIDPLSGFEQTSTSQTNESSNKTVIQQHNMTNSIYEDTTYTASNSVTNAGFTEST